MKRLLVLFLLCSLQLTAQHAARLSGRVIDTQGIPIAIGDALLFDQDQERLLQYSTVVNGAFSLDGVAFGAYVLKISGLGYATFETPITIKEDRFLTVTLQEDITELDGVSVIAAKNPISYASGNVKVDVTNPYFNTISDPVELMARIPTVQLATDRESFTLLGKGTPLIYLSGQRISMEEFLNLLVTAIQSIELINSPSAKYEADGRAVVKVTLSRQQNLGMQGSIQETVSFKRNFNNYLASNLTYANDKLTLRGNLAYNKLQQWESNSFLFEIPERELVVDYAVRIPKNQRVQWNGGFGAYYQWNETDYISLNSSVRLQTDEAPFDTETSINDRGDLSNVLTDTRNDNRKDYYSGSVNFNKKGSGGLEYFAGLQYSGFRQELETEIDNVEQGQTTAEGQFREQEYAINAFGFRIDLSKTFHENFKWEAGINASRAKAEAFTQISEGIDIMDPIDFAYDEALWAGYASVSGKYKPKIDFELGLRIEHNEVDGVLASETSPLIARENTNLFPKAKFNMTLDSTQTLNLSYARTIQRPDFSRSSSITVFINPFLEGTGNVNLRPTLTDEVSLSYQKGSKTVFLNLYKSRYPTNFTISYDATNDIALLSLVNLDKEIGGYLGLTLPFTKGIWTSNNTLTLNYNEIKDEGAGFSWTRPFIYAYTNHQLQIAKDTTLVLGAWAMGKRREGIFERNGLVVFEAAVSKRLFEHWDLSVRFNDITRAMDFEERYALNGVIADGVYFGDVREVAVALKYRFGNSGNAKFKNRNVDANSDRIR